jgi:hypothetical protein
MGNGNVTRTRPGFSFIVPIPAHPSGSNSQYGIEKGENVTLSLSKGDLQSIYQ